MLSSRSIGPIWGISLVFAGISRSADDPAGARRAVRSGRRTAGTGWSRRGGPRRGPPCRRRPGAAAGPGRPAGTRAAPVLAPPRIQATASARACAPIRPSSLVTVFPHGACRRPSAPVRAPAAASRSWPACAIHAVMPASVVLPRSTAISTSVRTDGRECRGPRRARGSGTAAKQSGTLPPDAACRSAARSSSAARALSASARSRSSSARRRSRCSPAFRSRSSCRRRAASAFRAVRLARASSRTAARRTISSASAIADSAASGTTGMRNWSRNGGSLAEKRCQIPLS